MLMGSFYLCADSKCQDFASLICVDRLDSAVYGMLRLIVCHGQAVMENLLSAVMS